MGVKIHIHDTAKRHPAQVGSVLHFLQLITDVAAFGVDAQQIVLGRHTRRKRRRRLTVQGIHLCVVALQHTHFTTDGDIGPIGIVGLDQHIHAGHAKLLGGSLFADTGQTVAGRDFASRVDGLRQVDAGHISAAHTQFHSHHIHVGQYISPCRRSIDVGQECCFGDFAVEFRLT